MSKSIGDRLRENFKFADKMIFLLKVEIEYLKENGGCEDRIAKLEYKVELETHNVFLYKREAKKRVKEFTKVDKYSRYD